GDIKAGKTAVADWLLKSSLQGKFIDYKATFEHINSLGKAELSLIKEVKIHELIHTVQVNHSNPDNLPDFLVNETFDAQFTPDIIYFSSGGTAPVKAVKNATIDAPPTLSDLTVQISAAVENGWNYFRLDEPGNSQYDIVKILRSDGTEIGLDNFWTTDRTFPATGRPIYENILHFLDNNATGGTKTYTVVYTPGGPTITDIIDVSPDPRATAVNAITVDFSEAIQASSFDYNDISLTLNNGTNLINSTVTIVSLSPTRYQISGLNTLTNNEGDYLLTINATGIQDTSGKFGSGSLTETWKKTAGGNADTTPPVVTDIVNLLINPRNQPVPSLTVTFSEKIDLSTFNWQDITLTRNGGTNLINNTVIISAINDTTYRINGLSGLTATDGTYTLTVNDSGIQDLSGNAGTGTQSETWVMDTTAPTAPSNIVVAGISANSAELQSSSLQILTTSGQTRINTTTPTISGELGETNLKVFFYDKNTNQLLKQATVTETQFSSSVELPSPGVRELEIRVQDAAGNTTNTSLSLFADVAPPVISQFLNVPTSTPNPVNTIDVQFSEQINLNTFDKSDITLSRDGVNLTLPNTVTVTYLSDTTYRINGLDSLTNTPGVYSLKVDATTIQDNAGNSGDAAKTATFSITAPPTPGITLIQSGGSTAVTEGGNTDSYTLVLKTQPTADVTVTLNGGNQITIDKTTITFTAANWNIPQTVTVTAVDDTIPEGNHTSTISHSVSSTDTNYNNATLPNVAVSITDNDAEIRGMKWHDIDGNGVKDAGETGLAGWTIYLDTNTNGQLDNGEISTITDTNGNYQFTNLRPGIYTIAEVQQTGWKQTFPGVNITTTAAEIPLYTPTLDIISPASNNEVQLNFNAANYIVKEDGTAVTEIWVTRTGNASNTVSATLSFIDGTAKGCGCAASSVNNDFNNIPITVTFAANETSKLVYVQNALLGNPNAIKIRNDEKVEGDEYFTIKLTNPTGGATIGNQSSATVTIVDDDAPSSPTVTPPLETPSVTISSLVDSQATSLINLGNFWADSRFANIKGNGLTTVIIDTGIDLNHPVFGADADNNGIADKIVYEYDFADNDTDASDKNNHGSHIASIFTSVAPESNIIALKVFKDNGAGSFSDLEKALQWVASNSSAYNIASVNLSIGDSQNWTTATSRYGIGDELAAIASQNIIISAAAGNSFYQYGSNPGLAYPAIDPNVIAVGAVWADNSGTQKNFVGGAIDYTTTADQIASFSQRDRNLLDVFAPGILITGANANGGTTSMGGTSQATAYFTGVATLAQEIAEEKLGRKLTVNEFRNLLSTNSVIINDGDNENDNVINTGANYPRVDLLKLAESILNLSDATSNPNPVDPGNNNNNGATTILDNTINLVHTVNLTAGEVRTGIDFGNQQIIVNHPPTVTNLIADQNAKVNSTFTFTLPKNTFSDPDAVNLYKNLVIFGDSLSDTGNAYQASGNTFPPPPNYQGRLSNGLIWVDYLAQNLQFTDQSIENFAFLGANTGESNTFGSITVPGLLTQIQQFKTLNTATPVGKDGLYVIWAGANDFLNLATDPTQAVTNAVTNISSAITTLAELGAKEIVVGNLTDLGATPLSIANNNVDNARLISIGFNAALTQALTNLEPVLNVNLSLVDIFGLSAAVQANPASYNFTNITQPLITATNPVDPNQYAFWDDFHPTTKLHQLVTGTFENTLLNDGVIPDLIKYSATLADGSNLPDWLNFNSTTRTFTGTPKTANIGQLNVKVIATDKDGANVSDIFTLYVENVNNAPTNLTLSNSTVAENKIVGKVVGNLSTTDPDTGNTFTYSLVSGTGATDNSLFTITNNRLKTNSVFDFETKNSYTIRVKTTDQGGLSFEKQLTIGVSNVNETPTNLTLSNSTVAENKIVGTVVGNLSTTDPDTGNTFTYSLVTRNGATDNSLFTISGNQLKTNSVFDFETKNSYNIRVKTTDQGGLTYQKQLTINISDLTDNTITGTANRNNITTTNDKDIIDAVAGNDTITSVFTNLQQNDNINGGPGTDTLIITGGTSANSLTINANNTTNQIGNITGTTVLGFERFDLSYFTGKVNLTGTDGNDWIKGGSGTDNLSGGKGNDSLYLGSDTAVDNVNYVLGDGRDTVYQFVRGAGGDKLNFTGIANFDVITSGTSTLVRVGDGIGGNAGFGNGQLLVTLSGTSGFNSTNANLNLFGGNFLFS
ncbi:MAG: S8 family serine peptidase, partial [Dolichospermum sp.]